MRSTKNRPAIDALDMSYLVNRLKDGGKVVNLTRRPRFTPQENYLINSWYSFLLEAESTPRPQCGRKD
jgi:hypothetical protein